MKTKDRIEAQDRLDAAVEAAWGPRGWAHVNRDGTVTLGHVPEAGSEEREEYTDEAKAMIALSATD